MKFLPIVTEATQKVALADRHNPFATKAANPGLMKKIRADPVRTGSRILQAVFGK